MSFYLSYTKSIKTRKVPYVFYFKGNLLCSLCNKIETEILNLEKDVKNPVITALNYVISNNVLDSEILLPSLNDELFDEACDVISKYLLENDCSIGLLTNNSNFRNDYSNLIKKYGITYSVPREKVVKKTQLSKPTSALATTYDYEIGASLNSPKRYISRTTKRSDDIECGLIVDEPFNVKLLKFLNESGKTNVEVYTKGGITRQVFSNIISKKDFIPRKDTVICLIIGMELNYIDAIDLLECAGYTLSKSIVSDVVVMKYLKRGEYNLDIINDELDERGCSLLGWKPRDK